MIISCGNQYVIHVNKNITWIASLNGGKDLVHKVLECGRGVGKSEKHDFRFEDSIGGVEDCFPLVLVAYPDVVISPMDV